MTLLVSGFGATAEAPNYFDPFSLQPLPSSQVASFAAPNLGTSTPKESKAMLWIALASLAVGIIALRKK